MDTELLVAGITIAELIGYTGSLIIAISMLMTSILKMRWMIFSGNVVFIVYGTLIGAYPIIVLNGFNLVVNAYFIWQAYKLQGNYAVLAANCNAPMLERFLVYYVNDIRKYFPQFEKFEEEDVVFLIAKGTAVISVAGFRKNDDGSFNVVVDYVANTHRNMKPGKLLYERENIFSLLNTDTIYAQSFHFRHTVYLRRMGFKPSEDGNAFVLKRP
ncbi:hypothetical protein SDC9_53623 [bioreactor metagenome]|uniref:N-acetyltransferase domain-containing protein n=1 Tax=bioreactor metagenome TaxID=1076179 RepID=A0A644WUF7_9ZZZZ